MVMPGETPDIHPVAGSMVAMALLLLDHTPPVGVQLSIVNVPRHSNVGPVMGVGVGITVIVLVATQLPAIA